MSSDPSTTSAAEPSPLSATLLTGRSLVLLQLLSRLLTFGLNQTLVRLAPPEVFGTAAIQLDLVSDTIRFLSREGIRNALLRSKSDHSAEANARARRLASMPLLVGLGIAILTVGIYVYPSDVKTRSQADFHVALGLYVLAALLELGIEPLYIRTLRATPPRMRVRVQAEGGMAIVRAVVTVVSLVFLETRPLLGFALGQAAGAIWLAGRYAWEYGFDFRELVWSPGSKGQDRFDPATLSLSVANTGQSVIKHVLTEANRLVVGRISPLRDQGGYAVAMNYGSLIARIVFQPLEETLLLHFSSHLRSPSSDTLLSFILYLSSHLLLILPAFLPPLLPALLPLLLPRRYLATSAPSTLETYLSWYMPLLSLNGILEAFHSSSATSAEVAVQARWMIASFVAFTGVLYSLTHVTADTTWKASTEQSLIFASCAGMVVRILYAYLHARRFFGREGDTKGNGPVFGLKRISPSIAVIGVAALDAAVLRERQRSDMWKRSWVEWILYVGPGGVLGLGLLGVIWWTSRERVAELRRAMRVKG